ncbi:MAG: hypothetical protein AAGD11_15255 [Planctomycetota bacterium]
MPRLLTLMMVLGSLTTSMPSAAQPLDSVDQALLEDLGADLLEATDESNRDVLDQSLLAELGEDIGRNQQAEQNELAKVVKHMKRAHSRLQRVERTNEASAAQSEALVGLEVMIAEITKRKSQCQGGSCRQPATQKPDNKKEAGGKTGDNPAESATSAASDDANLSTELYATGNLVKDLWGKLPARQRQQILQPLSEEFLPKYAAEIEAYFRALAQPENSAKETP